MKNLWKKIAEDKITSEDLPAPKINPFDAQDKEPDINQKDYIKHGDIPPASMPEVPEGYATFPDNPKELEQILNNLTEEKKKDLQNKKLLWDKIHEDLMLKELDKELK